MRQWTDGHRWMEVTKRVNVSCNSQPRRTERVNVMSHYPVSNNLCAQIIRRRVIVPFLAT